VIAVIFDIDGTLIESMRFDTALYIKAVNNVFGDVVIHYDWNYYHNVTDTGILSEILKENGYDDSVSNMNAVRTEFGKLVSEYLSNNHVEALPGAIDLIQRMKTDSGFVPGIATGGWGHTARLKLVAAGFDIEGIPICSSDDSSERMGIMTRCLALIGNNFDGIYYIGDAEWDIAATRRLGWEFIGVGKTIKDKCKKWVMDFKDDKDFLNLLGKK
jgi:phosphoglycolate phosphatase-like HAD superfamily hydrolase